MSRGEERRGTSETGVPERLKELDSALALIAHELRTPLTVMKGWADALTAAADRMDREMLMTSAAAISRNADQMSDIIRNMAGMSAIEDIELALILQETLVSELVEGVTGDLERITGAERIEVSVEDDALLRIDTPRVRQILINLITNAVKFSPPDTHVKVKVERHRDVVAICISDHGAGIEAARYEELFQKYSRLGAKEKGTGLGLYISRKIARALGGDLVLLDDAAATGCNFMLSLPIHGSSGEDSLQEPSGSSRVRR